MRYKIHHEPMYSNECIEILYSIVKGTSIKDEMEELIEKHGMESMRPPIEEFFKKPLETERYMKNNICLNLPGYENIGQKMAEFLFEKWGCVDAAPINAVYFYDLLLSSGIDNKAIVIVSVVTDDFHGEIWEHMESNTSPPLIEDSVFFGLINNSRLGQEEKLNALALYYDFDLYYAYARALLKHTEELLKSKIREYSVDIKAHMDFVEEHVLANNAALLKNKIGISIDDNSLHHIYPSIYCTHSLSLHTTGLIPPYIIIGISVFSLEAIFSQTESGKNKAAQFLKALSDNTKQTILQLLKNEAMYGSQLAEKLNCSSANISQHMSALVGLGVVSVRKENNRVYFYLNKEAIHKHLETAKELFG